MSEDIDLDIDEKDLRIDTYRSQGAGGQHVNKTDSAIRITHLPTGIVVQCQNERSQLAEQASPRCGCCKGRLVEREREQREAEMAKERGEVLDNAFGSQIRSYVLHPYSMVTDHRTGRKESNAQGVPRGPRPLHQRVLRLRRGEGSLSRASPSREHPRARRPPR